MSASKSPAGYVPRRIAGRVVEALGDTRVVMVNGARQSGKSTLVRRIGKETGATWYTLDNAETRHLAANDPTGFVRFDDRMIVDEIQRDPELLLSIKELVDDDPVPGRFLLTGSARVLGLRSLPDTLVGRMETVELWPLSQGEIDGTPDAFVDAAFTLGPDLRHDSDVTRDEYIERLVCGGFPETITRTPTRRTDFLTGYVADLINRNVAQISEVERAPEMRALVRTLAAHSGQTIAPSKMDRPSASAIRQSSAISACSSSSSSSSGSQRGPAGSAAAVWRSRRSPWWTRGSRPACSA